MPEQLFIDRPDIYPIVHNQKPETIKGADLAHEYKDLATRNAKRYLDRRLWPELFHITDTLRLLDPAMLQGIGLENLHWGEVRTDILAYLRDHLGKDQALGVPLFGEVDVEYLVNLAFIRMAFPEQFHELSLEDRRIEFIVKAEERLRTIRGRSMWDYVQQVVKFRFLAPTIYQEGPVRRYLEASLGEMLEEKGYLTDKGAWREVIDLTHGLRILFPDRYEDFRPGKAEFVEMKEEVQRRLETMPFSECLELMAHLNTIMAPTISITSHGIELDSAERMPHSQPQPLPDIRKY